MNYSHAKEITQILESWNRGEEGAEERLLPFVYDELRRQARMIMSRERTNHTLQPTALVHEAFLRLSKQTGLEWQNRSHFFGIAARLMRQILVDHARVYSANKRGGRAIKFSIDEVDIPVEERAQSILIVDEVLTRLANHIDPASYNCGYYG